MTPPAKNDGPEGTGPTEPSDSWDEWWKPGAQEEPPAPSAAPGAAGPLRVPEPPGAMGPPIVVPPVPSPTGADNDDLSAQPPRSKRSMGKLVVIGGAAVVFVVGIALGVRAATSHSSTAAAGNGPNGNRNGPGGRGATLGTLASVHGSVLTVTTNDGNKVVVNTSGSTRVTRSSSGTLADIKVGDRVTFRGTSSGTNAVTAEQIGDTGSADQAPSGGAPAAGGPGNGTGTFRGNGGNGPPGGPGGGGFAAGTVAAINGNTMTVTATDGTSIAVTTSSTTTVTTVQPASISDLKAGETLRVVGRTTSNGSVTANAIQEGAGGGLGGFGGGRRNNTTTTTTVN